MDLKRNEKFVTCPIIDSCVCTHLELLHDSRDAQGRALDVITLEGPSYVNPRYASAEFAAGYIGFYLCNDAVILQKFGDRDADEQARAALQMVFPDRTIEQLAVDGIAAGGGSIHCATQQEPLA